MQLGFKAALPHPRELKSKDILRDNCVSTYDIERGI